MVDLSTHEFAVLRETIRARGGARIGSFLGGIASWALTLILVLIWLPNPMAAVIPLLVLVAAFEAVRVLHLIVERIGRYVQVFYEERVETASLAPPAWERAAMQFGPSVPGAGGHPLFLPIFLLATIANTLAIVFPGPLMVEAITLAVPHLGFIVWMIYCDRGMRKQRVSDLARYRALKAAAAAPPP
jgi:hypothetical protein